MNLSEVSSQSLGILKVITPWLTGGLAGAILTLLVKRREAKNERRVLAVDTHLTQYALPKLEAQEAFRQEDLRISYKGRQYAQLSLLECSGRNTGVGGIESQKLLFLLPQGINIVDKVVSFSPTHLEHSEDVRDKLTGKEYELTIRRLEPGDRAVVSMLVDGPNANTIQCLPRGVDHITYTIGQFDGQIDVESDIYKVLLLSAFMLIFSTVPLIAGMLESMVFIFMMPYLRRIIAYFMRYHRNKKPTTINVGAIHAKNVNISSSWNHHGSP